MLKYSIAAAALLASTSLALADAADRGEKGGGMSSSAAEHAPGQMKDSGSAKDFAPGQMKSKGSSAEKYTPGHLKATTAGAESKSGMERKSESSENSKADSSYRSAKSERPDRSAKTEARDRDLKSGSENAKSETAKSGSSSGASEGTEGRSGPKGSIANISDEQRGRAKTIFTRHHVEPARINVSVNVGVALPRSVHLYPVPEDIVVIVPDYRGYEYIMLDDDRVAIVDPDTFEVVDIIVLA